MNKKNIVYLEIVKNSLKSETDTLGAVVRLCRHFVDCLAQYVCEVQNLKKFIIKVSVLDL
jgi:hypothetical protein